MVVAIIMLTAIVLGCLFSEGLRILMVKILIVGLKLLSTFVIALTKSLGFGGLKIAKISLVFSTIIAGANLISAPVINYQLSDISVQDSRYVKNYWEVFNQIGKEKNLNPLFLLSVVKTEGGVKEGELINPANGQGIGQLYSWVVITKQYYFPPGPISRIEAQNQIALIADFVSEKCSDLNLSYDSISDISDETMWDRVSCFERYNGVRGGIRGEMDTYPAVFNNLDGYPELQGMGIPDGDLSTNLVAMQQDGYEVTYRKLSSFIAGQSDVAMNHNDRQFVVPDLSPQNIGSSLSEIKEFTPIAMIPYSLNSNDCSAYVSPGKLGPKIPPIMEDGWSISNGCHEALAIDLSTASGEATLVSPISGYVTAITNDGYCGPYGCGNSVLIIENAEWLVAFLHYKSIEVGMGDEIFVGKKIGQMGSVGNSTGPHLHYIVFNKSSNAFVYAGNYLQGD